LSDTLGDELKLATGGKARVFALSLKDRAAVLPAGSREMERLDRCEKWNWITSSYYRSELPEWVSKFNESRRAEKYLNREWKDSDGNCAWINVSAKWQGWQGRRILRDCRVDSVG